MNTASTMKACWIVSGIAVAMLFVARLPAAEAAGSVPVVQSTATPAPCAGDCQKVQPDVIALTDPVKHGQAPPPRAVIFEPKSDSVISRVVKYSQELDIELTASGGTHETIHLPITVAPPSSALRFPQAAKLDSVMSVGVTARILYHQGSRKRFNVYTVSQSPFMTAP